MDRMINYKKRVIILILTLSFFRLILAGTAELGNDESYYWVYSQYLQWNYFDHPPLIAIFVRIFTLNLYLQDHLVFLRLGSIVACGFSTWFMFKTVSTIANEKAGFIAACLYSASFYSGLTAGLLIMPDAPQMFFWTFSLWMISKIFVDENNWTNWVLLGIASGLCIMSKVHGVYIWGGVIAFILLYNRELIKNPRLYFSAFITLVLVSPILIWNIKNDFITYRFHSERIIIHGYLFNINNFLKEFFEEIIVNNPINIILILLVLFHKSIADLVKYPALRTFRFIGFALISVVLFLSLFRDTRPIWSGPGYITLIPLTAIGIENSKNKIIQILSKWSLYIYIFLSISLWIFIKNAPGTFGSKISSDLGKGDITLDMYGWKEAGKEFINIYDQELKKGIAFPGSPLVCNTWWGAHEEYYFCRINHLEMIGLGSMMELHHYMWTNNKRENSVNMNTAYCVIHSDENYSAQSAYSPYYSQIDSIATIHILRKQLPAHNFVVYRLKGWKNKFPEAN